MSPERLKRKSESPSRKGSAAADIVRVLTKRKQALALAESCTGGFIANQITNVPGASKIFKGGVVSYSNEAKEKFLGVNAETLKLHGAVSKEVAAEMATGAKKRFAVDYAIAVTGIAGPTGGTKAKPTGTVFIAVAGKGGTIVERKLNQFDREKFKEVTARQALKLLEGIVKAFELT
ncbi:MAG TPA: CinA family protein [Verrucomicrobiae bacterium]|jgi:nicotinamide-nucleotide amidase|nr:CinA family protein [Verrucomicrobiae bacterium]